MVNTTTRILIVKHRRRGAKLENDLANCEYFVENRDISIISIQETKSHA
jgi:hypothetical protein